MSSYLEVQLAQQPIELCKLLKVADLVGGGGEAKVVISEGYVLLNGEVEFQKRKKVYHNDIVEFNGEVIQVIVNEDLAEQKGEPDQNTTQAASSQKNATNKQAANENKAQRKRKPISF
ncbi:MAG: RNA-binding S4 domain-containing protein [Colwellia sp.]|nr:RNA-binding S4 domain-containing protein [Colwellia sp.]MCW8863805.1 RNA-binding S4 domain-containing protein [Colwellia sp.]MCW9081470.1 RNA-binding S4 domain-containing protein [Colwellia sp.]